MTPGPPVMSLLTVVMMMMVMAVMAASLSFDGGRLGAREPSRIREVCQGTPATNGLWGKQEVVVVVVVVVVGLGLASPSWYQHAKPDGSSHSQQQSLVVVMVYGCC